MSRYYQQWAPYVPVAERRRRALKQIAKMQKAGRKIAPVVIDGRKITNTFWGNAWSENLEAYSDFANRVPRGRTYVRNGSVLDLQINSGLVTALVSGSRLYEVEIKIKPLPAARWSAIKQECGGKIGSVVELLQGTLSKGVMEVVTRQREGLFPSPKEISMYCSCPDGASMCKHLAAALYGVGARLDHSPEMLFTLRRVDPGEMVVAAIEQGVDGKKTSRGRVLQNDDLSSVFGIDLSNDDSLEAENVLPLPKGRRGPVKKITPKKAPAKATAKKATAKKAPAKAPAKKPVSKKTTKDTTVSKDSLPKKVAAKKKSTKIVAKIAPVKVVSKKTLRQNLVLKADASETLVNKNESVKKAGKSKNVKETGKKTPKRKLSIDVSTDKLSAKLESTKIAMKRLAKERASKYLTTRKKK